MLSLVMFLGLHAQNKDDMKYFNLILPNNTTACYRLTNGIDIHFQDSMIVVNDNYYYMGEIVKYYFSGQQVQTYTLTVYCDFMQGFVVGGGSYPSGSYVTITANAYEDYVFDHWSDGITDNPRVVLLNNDLSLEAYFNGTGVEEDNEFNLYLYPNPVKESLRIEGLETKSELFFYNVLGLMVKKADANPNQEINVSELSPGVYIIRCGKKILRFMKE